MTWTMRARSAISRGRSSGRSMPRVRLPAPLRKVLRAWSTSAATSVGSGDTDRVPVTIRPWSSRSPSRPRMWSACSSMTRKNCSISAGSGVVGSPSTVAVEPLMATSGVRSSWLTMPRNSARMRSISSSGARSCRVTIIDSTVPPPGRIGVALTRVVTLRPSGTESVISSARTVSMPAPLICRAIGSSASETSRPSARRHVTTSSSSSSERSGMLRPLTMRRASRLIDTGSPVAPSKTTTPTGEMSISVSRSALARRSSRCVRALAMAVAACEANSTSTSSSASVNSRPPAFSARKKLPTCSSRWRIGVPSSVFDRIRSVEKPSALT